MNTHEAFRNVLDDVLTHGAECSPRSLPCLELRDYKFVVDKPSAEPIITRDVELNEKIAAYTRAEFELYDSGSNSAKKFAKRAKLWDRIQNPDGSVNSAYGYLAFVRTSCGKTKFAKHRPLTPWEWAELSLKRDKDSRQAFVRFSHPSHQWFGNRDQPCTMHANFHIRGEKLHLTVVMRSTDVRRGLVYDMPWFCSLLWRMKASLMSHYPSLELGTYAHFTHSMHVYKTDVEECRRMI